MECPKCGDEMEKGFLVMYSFGSTFGIGTYWCKDSGLSKTTDRVNLPRGLKREAQICKKCKVVQFEYP